MDDFPPAAYLVVGVGDGFGEGVQFAGECCPFGVCIPLEEEGGDVGGAFSGGGMEVHGSGKCIAFCCGLFVRAGLQGDGDGGEGGEAAGLRCMGEGRLQLGGVDQAVEEGVFERVHGMEVQ